MIFIGITFALLLYFIPGSNRDANKFLCAVLIIAALWMGRILTVDMGLATYNYSWGLLPLQFSLALGPLFFFYVLKTTQPKYQFRYVHLLHFIPVLTSLLLWLAPIRLNPAWQFLGFVSVTNYLYGSHKLIEAFNQHLPFNSGDRGRNELRWLHHLLMVFGVLWLLWIPFTVAAYFCKWHAQAYNPWYLLIMITIIWIAVKAYLRLTVGIPAVAAEALKPLLPIQLKQKAVWLKNEVKVKRYYEDPELSLGSLAQQLELSGHELSKIINTVFKKSFNDFINEYRVYAVARKMQDPAYDHITLLGIAYESGFNSQSTFTRIFKQTTGKSPAEYKTRLKKDYPSYNLGSHQQFATLISNQKSNRNFMFKNYFKTAMRNLMRNRSYAAINITGLAIGIASCLLIFLVVQYETSFDNFHSNKDKIYRIITVSNGADGVTHGSGVPLPLAEGLRLDFPQLKQVSNIMQNDGSHYSVNEATSGGTVKKFKEDLAYYADPQFFQIFDFKWLAGDKNTALAEPNAIVLTRDEANKFFGDWHIAMGKIVRYENKHDFKVTGILENTPVNTDFPMKLVVSWVTMISKDGDLSGNAHDWISTFSDHNCYILLPPNSSIKKFNTDLAAFAKKHIPPPYNKSAYQLEPLNDMHYNTELNVFSGHTFSKQLISVISLIGLFLLLIACVNFINLATAQAVNRSKEVGVRKVLGGNRNQLVLQFISETLIITLFAVVLAVIIAMATLPMLNNLLEIQLSNKFLFDAVVVLFLVAVVGGVTLLAGLYPALVLSGFSPIEALRNKVKAGRASGISLRRVLVVAQFCIAQFLVIGTLVLISQMNYFKNKPLGFTKDAVVSVPFPGDSISRTKINAFKNQLLQQPGIKDVSFSFASPSDNNSWHSDFKFNNSPKQTDFSASLKWADAGYFKLYNIPFVAGGPYRQSDTISGYVVNETLMKKLGYSDPKQIIGKYIMLWDDKKKHAQITGVGGIL